MKTYVCHYSKNHQRKKDLMNDPRFNILEDVTWIDWYDQEDIESYWVKSACTSNLSLQEISCCLKHYEAMYHMVKNDIPEALIFEDDVVFTADWLEKLKTHLAPNIEFIRLDSLFNLVYDGNIKTTDHLWPAEAWYIKKNFAEFILKNCTFSAPIDNSVYRLIIKLNMQIPILPLCSQTSMLTKPNQIFSHELVFPAEVPWKHYNYFETKKLMCEASIKKRDIETKFFEKYGRKINLKMPAYLELNDLGSG
jgi:GR25 family glycosyltransferase involved in LPS biosynthesis